jgi:hypothetical protein
MFPNILIVRRDRLLRAPHDTQNLDPVAVACVCVYGPWGGREPRGCGAGVVEVWVALGSGLILL